MKTIYKLTEGIELPKMTKVKQILPRESIPIEEIETIIFKELERFSDSFKPGMRIAITCGSRGIANIQVIIKSIVDYLKTRGAEPFVIPAMGSHGGATSEGQKAVLASYGVDEENIGCPVISSMATISLGKTPEGIETYIDRKAYEADGIIACGRIKPHTSFRYEYESGLMKMLSVGIGKQKGAETIHCQGLHNIPLRMVPYAMRVLEKTKVICGIGIIENAFHETYKLVGLSSREIPEKEPKLLREAWDQCAKIYLDNIDVLVVGEMGKNFSGDGMDCNLIGRFPSQRIKAEINVQHIVVLDLSKESKGNGNGIGWADVTTKKLLDKLDFDATYANAFTSTCLNAVRIPFVADCGKEAVKVALSTCIDSDRENPRVVFIRNTRDLGTIFVSKAMITDVEKSDKLNVEGKIGHWEFNVEGEIDCI